MLLTQEYLVEHNIKNVHVEVTDNLKYVSVLVVFINRTQYKFILELKSKSNLYNEIGDKIHEYIVVKDRKKKLKKIKNKLLYEYFRRLFKRT